MLHLWWECRRSPESMGRYRRGPGVGIALELDTGVLGSQTGQTACVSRASPFGGLARCIPNSRCRAGRSGRYPSLRSPRTSAWADSRPTGRRRPILSRSSGRTALVWV